MVLLNARALIVDVQRGNHAIRDDPSAKAAGSGFGHSSIEDQLDLLGPADIQIFTYHIPKEDPAADGAVKNRGQGQLDLENRDLVSVSGLPISGRKRMRQA